MPLGAKLVECLREEAIEFGKNGDNWYLNTQRVKNNLDNKCDPYHFHTRAR
jgi:hypothetical protein